LFEQTAENDAPVYVRKLTRKSHWGKTEEDPDARLQFVLDQVFRRDDPSEAISVYEVRNHRDLEKVAIGLNSGRTLKQT